MVDESSRQALEARLKQRFDDETVKGKMASWPYVSRRCRRIVPRPNELAGRLAKLFGMYARVRDDKTGKVL
jgi:hypothetical protein